MGASERDRRPIPTVSVWGQSQTAVVLLWSLSFYWEVSNILPEVRKGNLILLIMCFSRTAMDLETCGECCTTRCSVSDHSSELCYCPTVTQDVNLRMLASRYLTIEQGCWGVCVTNRTLVIMASVCNFDMGVLQCLVSDSEKKWHSVRYTPPKSECDRLSQEPQLDFYRQHMLQHMLGTPLYSICNW